MNFFGPVCMRRPDDEIVPAPVGRPCILCDELIVASDAGTVNRAGQISHYECSLRAVVGSVGHQLKRCSCYGGDQEDPEGMTRRQAAVAASRVHAWLESAAGMRSRNPKPSFELLALDGVPSIRCLTCDHVSSNPDHVATFYCAGCRAFHKA